MSNITDEQLRSVFDLFDADGSGFVDVEELGLAMNALGFGMLPKEEVDALVAEATSEGNSRIEFADFRKLCKTRMSTRNSIEEMRKAYKLFDQGAKDQLTVDDFVAIAKELGEIPAGDAAAEKRYRDIFTETIRFANETVLRDAHNKTTGISFDQWRVMMREAVSDKHHRLHDDSAYSIKTKARVAKKSPFGVRVEAGKTYYWCACGLSKNQPFCDGSHAQFNKDHNANIQPVKYVADQTRTVWFCGCKQTRAPPFCDGTHTSL